MSTHIIQALTDALDRAIKLVADMRTDRETSLYEIGFVVDNLVRALRRTVREMLGARNQLRRVAGRLEGLTEDLERLIRELREMLEAQGA